MRKVWYDKDRNANWKYREFGKIDHFNVCRQGDPYVATTCFHTANCSIINENYPKK